MQMTETASPTEPHHEDWPLRLSKTEIVFAAENLIDARSSRQALDGSDPEAVAHGDAAVSAAEARVDQALRRRDSIVAGRR